MHHCVYVAPYVGAWIETLSSDVSSRSSRSHPTWVRGLKRGVVARGCEVCRSHPTWVRGLKRARWLA